MRKDGHKWNENENMINILMTLFSSLSESDKQTKKKLLIKVMGTKDKTKKKQE